jgi:hypothetical protein
MRSSWQPLFENVEQLLERSIGLAQLAGGEGLEQVLGAGQEGVEDLILELDPPLGERDHRPAAVERSSIQLMRPI